LKKFATDVLIIGGGSAGIAAAISAAKSGVKVLLIERNEYLGGKATAAEVGTVCGLYVYSKEVDVKMGVSGFAREFAERLQEMSESTPMSNSSGLHFLPYSIEKYKELSLAELTKHGVNVFLQTELKDVKIKNDEVIEALVLSNNSHVHLSFKTIIDSTGNSLVSKLAGLPLITSASFQAAAQVFRISGLSEVNEALLGMILMRETAKAIQEKALEPYFDRVYVVPGSLNNGSVSLKLAVPLEVKKDNHTLLKEKAIEMIDQLMTYLCANNLSFKNTQVEHIADELGIRTDLRPKGKYILTEQDVLNCKKFDSAIANGFWPIEEWTLHRSVQMHYFKEKDHYQIPAECLISLDINNLFFAGRAISADDKAIASARVIGTCLQTGYAAGKLAASKTIEIPLDFAIKAIQEVQIFV
jgi:hypothetical protein